MSSNTELLGVKVKAHTKENINKLIDKAKAAGMIEYNGDIFDLFVEKFNQDELSQKLEYGADLKELNQITRRINDIFINLATRNDTNIQDLNSKHEEKIAGFIEEINELKVKLKESKEVLTERDIKLSELTDVLKVNQNRMKELESTQNGYIERIDEQKLIIEEKEEKIAIKNELLSQKEETISMMKEDIAQNDKLKKDIDFLTFENAKLQQVISAKEEELQRQKDNLEFACQKRVFAREQELNKAHAKEMKEIQERFTKELNQLQSKYEKAFDDKDKLRNATYELKVTLDREQSENEKKTAEITELKKYIEQLEDALKNKE